jgi:hypothetical protein
LNGRALARRIGAVISKEAQKFWDLIRSYPRQIDMSLMQARAADLLVERAGAISDPEGVSVRAL